LSNTQALFEAIRAGDLAQARALLEQDAALAQARDTDSVPLLMKAIYFGRAQIADLLLEHGAEPDIFAAAVLGKVERLKALAQADPQLVHAYSPDGWTALHLAAHFGQREAVEALLAAGASVQARSHNMMHNTPLHAAMPGGKPEIVEALLASGAEVNAQQEGGFTALHEAASQGNAALIKLLLARGADPALASEGGKMARDFAVEQGHTDLLPLFESK
jgi:ankyrin repeat protein